MRGTIGDSIRRAAAGVSAMIARPTAQDTNAASSNTAAIAMAIMAETAMEMETGTIVAVATGVGAVEAMAVMALSAARQYGYQDGMNDGARDRRTGHSNRPTQDSNYKHADRGYSSSYGNKDYYKQAYRQAYENGYQQGYNSGGGWRRY